MKFSDSEKQSPFYRFTAKIHNHENKKLRDGPIIKPQHLLEMGQIKEIRKNDLLLISTVSKLTSQDNIKNPDLISHPDMILAFVDQKASGPQYNNIEILVDKKQARQVLSFGFVYAFDSLSTCLREYKMIRLSEKLNYAEILYNPRGHV